MGVTSLQTLLKAAQDQQAGDALVDNIADKLFVALKAVAFALLAAAIVFSATLKKILDGIFNLVKNIKDAVKNAVKAVIKKIMELLPKDGESCAVGSGNCFVAGTLVKTLSGRVPIEQLQVGDRIDPALPTGWERVGIPLESNFTDWRRLELLMVHDGASITQATLLRPAAWVQEMQADIGGTIVLNLPDLGIEGPARIVDLDSVTVERGPGRLVTAVFHHSSGKVYDLQVEGESNTIGVTGTHPFWSMDRKDWVSASALRFGEQLLAENGTEPRVQSVNPRAGSVSVFNLEVDADHVYRVGELGLLVHNDSPGQLATLKQPKLPATPKLPITTPTGSPPFNPPTAPNTQPPDCNPCKDYAYKAKPDGFATWTAYVQTKCVSFADISSIPNAHGHHIVMKGNRFPENEKARKILCKYKINPYTDCENLVIAQNHCHSQAYATEVLNQLDAEDKSGNATTASIAQVLTELARWFKNCKLGGEVDVTTDELKDEANK